MPGIRLDELLDSPRTAELAKRIDSWVEALPGRLLAGDALIGLLSVDELRRVPEALDISIACGSTKAWDLLARWLTEPEVGEPDLVGADRAACRAIEADPANGWKTLFDVRWHHRRDDATPEQRRELVGILEARRASDEDGSIRYSLALLTNAGFGTPADPEQAFALLTQAAALDHADALFELGVYRSQGIGAPKDEAQTVELIRRAAELNHPRALYNMGAFHASGTYVAKDMAAAASWYERAWDVGHLQAGINLALMYGTGDGVKLDRSYAAELLNQVEWCGGDVDEMRERLDLPAEPDTEEGRG